MLIQVSARIALLKVIQYLVNIIGSVHYVSIGSPSTKYKVQTRIDSRLAIATTIREFAAIYFGPPIRMIGISPLGDKI